MNSKIIPKRNGLSRGWTFVLKNVLIICIALSSVPVFAEVYSQTAVLNIAVKDEPMEKVLDAIEKQSEFRFLYNKSQVDVERKVTIVASNKKVDEILAEVTKGTDISYTINNRQIVLSKKSAPTAAQQIRQITGKIVDDRGEPVIGANVAVKGTGTGAISDMDGNFVVNATNGQVLSITYVGYQPREIPVTSQSVYNVTIVEDTRMLSEVIVVGYGTQKRVNLTGAVDQVTSEVFENRPITNISQGLVGAVPNLNIKMMDGKPNQSPQFNIRGTTSIGQKGSALILIDGVEGDPKMLNPNDIESVSVLKDAASASIYGARAAYGVVLITTKAASKGRVNITYSGNFASKSPTTVPDNMNESYPWAAGFNEAWSKWQDVGTYPTAINKTMSFSQDYLAEIKNRWEHPDLPRVSVDPNTGEYKYYYSTDWYKQLYKDSYFSQDHNFSINGGNDLATFYISGRYNKDDGLFRYSPDTYDMANMRAKGTLQVTDWLSIENNMEYSSMNYVFPYLAGEGSGVWRNMADEGFPLAPLTNPDGTITMSAAYTVGDMYYGKNNIKSHQRVLKDKISAKADLLDDKSLVLRADFTYQNNDEGRRQKRVPVPYSRYEGKYGKVGANREEFTQRSMLTEYIATNVYADYTKTFNDVHHFNFLGGFNYEQSQYKNLTATRNGLVFEDAEDISLALGQTQTMTGGFSKWAIAGGFFRVNYNFNDRYLLEVNGRYDGSSKFPSNQQWGFFPSASFGWRLSEEKFWKVDPKALSDVKVRLSYGSLGNGNISPYSFVETYSISQSGRVLNGIRPQRTSQPGIIPNELTWETSTTANIGLDFAAFNNRLRFSGDVYRRWTTDMFTVGPSVPAVFGATVPKGNYADMYTQGWEISINWADKFMVAGKPLNYDVRFILSDYISEITKYNNPEKNLSDYYEGMRIGELWGYRVAGLFRTAEEIASSPSQVNIPATNTKKNYPGDLKFVNMDGDNVIWQGLNRVGNSGDKVIIGNTEPRFMFGLNLGADWNGFFVSAFFQGVMKQDYYPGREARFWGQYNRPYNYLPNWHIGNYYKEELGNFDAYLPRYKGYVAQGANRELSTPNDRYLQNVAYVRLRNLQIGYTIPKHISQKFYAQNVKVYLSAENLFTLSPWYKWQKDTDVTNIYGSNDNWGDGGGSGDGYNYPMLKSISAGVTINF